MRSLATISRQNSERAAASDLAAQLVSASARRPVLVRDAISLLGQRDLLGQPLPTLFHGGKPLGGPGIERLS